MPFLLLVLDAGMAAMTIIYWEGHGKVTHPAEPAFEDVIHQKMFGALLFDVENVRVAIGAVNQRVWAS